MARTYDIAIAGLGIAGAAVAARLARGGHRVTVFEQALRVGPVGAGILLQPSGQEILARWGLLDDLARRCEPIAALHAVHESGRTLVRVPYSLTGVACCGLGVHRADLFSVLHAECVAAGVSIRLGHVVRERIVDGDRVRLVDADGGDHGPFDFLLAADGSHSRLRRTFGQVAIDHEYRHGALWRVGTCEAVRGELRQTVRGTRQLIGLLPTGGGRCSFFASLRTDARQSVLSRGFDRWRAEIVRTCPASASIVDEATGFDDFVFTTYRCVLMQSMFDRHTLFLGDAAHASSPHLGQGVNLALIDAEVFDWALRVAGDFPTACRLWHRSRRKQLRLYALLTAALTPFFQSDGMAKGWLRNAVLPWMPGLPWVGRQMALTMAGMKIDWLQSTMPHVLDPTGHDSERV